MGETFREQVSRVTMMSRDDGSIWDLSVNDQAALRAVLKRMAILDEQVQALLTAAKTVIARGEEEGWIDYNGTDESRLDVLEEAVDRVEEANG